MRQAGCKPGSSVHRLAGPVTSGKGNFEHMDNLTPSRRNKLIEVVLNATETANTRRAYARQLATFFEWCQGRDGPQSFDRALVQAYLASLRGQKMGSATINQALASVRKLASEAAAHGWLDLTQAQAIASIKNSKHLGTRTGTWLNEQQAAALLKAPDTSTLGGLRDRVVLGLLLECGLRREEVVTVSVDQVQKRDNRYLLADLKGKGNRTRTVPVPWRCALRIAEWQREACIHSGYLLRAVDKAGRVMGADRISTTSIYKIVRGYAQEIGIQIAPHDLRRTFGRIARQRGAELDQIQVTLGHADVKTTMIYLGDNQDLRDAPCDKMDLEGNTGRDDE